MIKTEYHISKMDCPSEENMIRMKLEGLQTIKKLDFDIENRNLTVTIQGDKEIFPLESLHLVQNYAIKSYNEKDL
jgi:copper chaperone CopZ